jgi:hypothetical protein
MNKQKSINLLVVTAMTLLGAAFLFLGFFVVIIGYSDILDIRDNRLTGDQALEDIITLLIWIAIIPIFLYLKKKYRLIKGND